MCCAGQHGGHWHAEDAETYPQDGDRYCLCPGEFHQGAEITRDNVASLGKCCGAQSGADGYCDRCRTHCKPRTTQRDDQEPAQERAPLVAVVEARDLGDDWRASTHVRRESVPA